MPHISNIPLEESFADYLIVNGYRRLVDNITGRSIFLKEYNEAVIIDGITITYKHNIHNTAADALTVMNKWQTVRKYTGFNSKEVFEYMMLMHIMGIIPFQKIDARMKKHFRWAMLQHLLSVSEFEVKEIKEVA